MAKRISVVIPALNEAGNIGRLVEETFAAVPADMLAEVIVVDDGSCDGSRERVASFAPRHVRLHAHERNRGIGAARNTGLSQARGEFIGFLDQDDLFHPGKLERQLARFAADRSGELGVVLGLVDVHDVRTGSRRKLRSRPPRNLESLSSSELLRALLMRNFASLGSALLRKAALDRVGGFDESLRGGSDDFDLFVRLAAVCRFALIPRPLLIRREHGGNFTRAQRIAPDALRVLARVAAERPELRRAAALGASGCHFEVARELQIAGERERALAAFREALRAAPRLKPALGWLLCKAGPLGDRALSRWARARGR